MILCRVRFHLPVLLLLITFLSVGKSNAQDIFQTGSLSVFVIGPHNDSIRNANVKLLSGGYPIFPDSISKNEHIFRKVGPGYHMLVVSADGYETVKDTVDILRGRHTVKLAQLSNHVIQLKTVIVKGHQPALVYKGDTIVLNPGAVNIEEGDAVREILEQMPGVDIQMDKVSVQGKDIEKTYVDGKRTFGDNPMTAIDHVAANDVVNIKMYEEENKEEQRRGSAKHRRWVFNIITKSKLINSRDGSLVAGLGRTLGTRQGNEHQLRGVAGGIFNFFSEDLLLNANLMHNNINIPSNSTRLLFQTRNVNPTYGENSCATVQVLKTQPKEKFGIYRIDFKYGYLRKATEQGSTLMRDFNPTAAFRSRSYTSYTDGFSQDNSHKASLYLTASIDSVNELNLMVDGVADNNHTVNLQKQTDVVDEAATKNNTTIRNRTAGGNLSVIMSYYYHLKQVPLTGVIEAKFTHDSHNNSGNRLSEGVFNNNLLLSEKHRTDTWETSASTGSLIGKKGMPWIGEWEVAYKFSHSSEALGREGIDEGTGVMDSLNNYLYHSHLATHSPSFSLGVAHGMDVSHIIVSWNRNILKNTKVDSDGPRQYEFSNWSVNWTNKLYKFNSRLITELNYVVSSKLPALQQLRQETNNVNPLCVVSGNPNLRQTINHHITFKNDIRLSKQGMVLTINCQYENHDGRIVAKEWYFDHDSYMPEFNYYAPARTTLSSYANVSGSWLLNAESQLEIPLTNLRSSVRVYFNNDRSREPYFYNDVRDAAKINNVYGGLILRTSMLPHAYITMQPSIGYRKASSTVTDYHSDILTEGLKLNIQLKRFLKYFFLNASYQLNHFNYKSLGKIDNENIINLYLGAKVFRNRGEVNLTAYDLLNSFAARRVAMTENYTQRSEQFNYGRFISVNFVWNFRKVKVPRMDSGHGIAW